MWLIQEDQIIMLVGIASAIGIFLLAALSLHPQVIKRFTWPAGVNRATHTVQGRLEN